jgi:uncharacterized membrane protein YgdD (TMEM256/DUF423 family)
MDRRWMSVAAVLGFAGVALGAFGAHGLRRAIEGLPDAAQRLGWWETAARYHLVHALAVGFASVAAAHTPGRAARIAGALFVTGIVVFSGSLYVMGATGLELLGALTPVGGLAQLAGWALLAWAARPRRERQGGAR